MKTEAKIISLLRSYARKAKRCLSQHTISDPSRILRLYGHGQRHRPGKRADRPTFTAENLELAFSGVLRHVTLTARKKALLLTMNALLWLIDVSGAEGRKMNVLLEPFSYELCSMRCGSRRWSAVSALSCHLSDAKRLVADWRCVVALYCPGVAGAYMLGLPFSLGAFFSADWLRAACCFLTNAPA